MIRAYYEATMVFLVVGVVTYWSWIMIKRQNRQASTTKKHGSSSVLPRNWPLIGMAPAILWNRHRFHDFVTDILQESGGTFELKGPLFLNLNTLFTCDPANNHHILVKNAANFSKGTNFKKIFDGFGHAWFVSTGKAWEIQRRAIGRIFHHRLFPKFVANVTWQKVERGLIPVLDDCAASSSVVDLQDIIHRFTFDISIMLGCSIDPSTLVVGLPNQPVMNAFSNVMRGLFQRHFSPPYLWKLLKRLHVGYEKKVSDGWEKIHNFLDECISLKLEALREKKREQEEGCHDIITSFVNILDGMMSSGVLGEDSKSFLRDVLLNLLFASKDTQGAALTWFFWLLAQNPLEERKIREEITRNFSDYKKRQEDGSDSDAWSLYISNLEELNKLIYMRAAFNEALRLFSPAALHHMASKDYDILPSGHPLSPNERTVISYYSAGRMERIWGSDCLEFKPSRWIVAGEDGIAELRSEPTHKFLAFSAGARYCLGKDISLIQLQVFAATVIHKYEIEVIEGHLVSPKTAVLLTTKHGVKVKVFKR